jgi:hypothetical protein
MPRVTGPFVAPPARDAPGDADALAGRRLQVIVKVATIELTPDRPAYAGGTWHVEGCHNERIVATAIHYLECENVTPSRLAFREAVCEPDYEQHDHVAVRAIYDMGDEEPLVQARGAVRTVAGRTVCFPNVLQHRVEPFALADRARPGRRTIIVFFLVDPTRPVPRSTATVPPQQRAWLEAELAAARRWRDLPEVLCDHVLRFLVDADGGPMSHAAALRHRLALMEERKFITDENTAEVFERLFSLCEH